MLLVEDNAGERWMLSEILRARGHTVTACEDAEAAWDAFRREPAALVLLDLRLPGMDGLELCRLLRGHPSGASTVILVVTGKEDPGVLEEALDAGADDYVSKPVDVGLLHVRLSVAERQVAAEEALEESEQRFRTLAEKLQQANQELESFAYSVSHDLRAPLRTMQGFAHALLQNFGEGLEPEARDYVRRIIASGKQSESLIRDLLAYSRLSSEELEFQPVDLEQVVAAVREQMAADLAEARAVIEVDRALPTVMAQSTIMEQVLSNLLSNAVKFVPPERRPLVRVTAEETENGTRLWVVDNGIGVPPGQEERIFRVFERLAEGSDRPGTGIGLAIVRRGMARVGGRAGVERNADAPGSAFWIEIPRPLEKRAWRPWGRRG